MLTERHCLDIPNLRNGVAAAATSLAESDDSAPYILVVDDDSDVRAALRVMLQETGYEIVEAVDGREAMKRFKARAPSVIVTDIFMPEMDGLELLVKLRDAVPRVPVIVISGGGRHRDTTVVRTARALGAIEVLTKPFTVDDIVNAVRRVLGTSTDIRGT
jgi:CheY-like chemotaxis protein